MFPDTARRSGYARESVRRRTPGHTGRVGGEPVPGALTRRHALLAAGAGLAAVLVPVRPAWAVGGLQRRRAATYHRLVRLLSQAPDGRFANRPAGVAARAFARWYAGQDDAGRAHADAVLDALAARGLPGYEALAAAPDAVVAAAVGLAAIGCDPPPADADERPVTPPLWSAA